MLLALLCVELLVSVNFRRTRYYLCVIGRLTRFLPMCGGDILSDSRCVHSFMVVMQYVDCIFAI